MDTGDARRSAENIPMRRLSRDLRGGNCEVDAALDNPLILLPRVSAVYSLNMLLLSLSRDEDTCW